MDNKLRVLFNTPVLHHPPVGGSYLRIENSIKALSKVSELYIYSRVSVESLGGTQGLAYYQQYCQKLFFAPFTHSSKNYMQIATKGFNRFFRKLFGRNLFIQHSTAPREDYGHLLKIAESIQADVIWLGYGNISYPLLNYIKKHSNYKVVIDTDSVWSRFILRGLPFVENAEERNKILEEGAKKEEEERLGAKLADITTAVSEVDAEYYRSLSIDPGQVHIFSNVIDMDVYKHIPLPLDNFKNPCIYLAGSFWPKSPMEESARWVINHILPLVREQIPYIQMYIVGKGSDQVLSDIVDPYITITGQLPSVLPYLCHANVALVPLRFESGTRFKILEAGACGIPVVSTTLGAEGLPVTHEKDILIADSPAQFAISIVRLINDREFAVQMAQNLKSLVQEKNNISSLVQEGIVILEYLASLDKVV